MGSHQGGRWDVGVEGNVVYLERVSEDDEQVFGDSLEPDEARQLAGLLTKYADKAEEAGESDEDDDKSDGESDDDDDKPKDKDDEKPKDSKD